MWGSNGGNPMWLTSMDTKLDELCKKNKKNSKILHGSVQCFQEENWNCWLAKFEGKACQKARMQVPISRNLSLTLDLNSLVAFNIGFEL